MQDRVRSLDALAKSDVMLPSPELKACAQQHSFRIAAKQFAKGRTASADAWGPDLLLEAGIILAGPLTISLAASGDLERLGSSFAPRARVREQL